MPLQEVNYYEAKKKALLSSHIPNLKSDLFQNKETSSIIDAIVVTLW